MTKEEALHQFFNSFGIRAYPSSAVPERAMFPYMTYTLSLGAWGNEYMGLTVDLWYYTTDENEPNAMARKMSETIGIGGVTLDCEDGFIWLNRGDPWCQNISDDSDNKIKRRYLNITAQYLTTN